MIDDRLREIICSYHRNQDYMPEQAIKDIKQAYSEELPKEKPRLTDVDKMIKYKESVVEMDWKHFGYNQCLKEIKKILGENK